MKTFFRTLMTEQNYKLHEIEEMDVFLFFELMKEDKKAKKVYLRNIL